MAKYAKITGNCLLTSEDGASAENLAGRIGVCYGSQGDATILKIGNKRFPVPNDMLEMVESPAKHEEVLT